MKKIILSVAAFLFASGMAFAGSNHFDLDIVPAAGSYPTTHSMVSGGAKTVDPSVTKSVIRNTTAGQSTRDMQGEYGQGIWGR